MGNPRLSEITISYELFTPGHLFFIVATLNLTAIAETEAQDAILPKLPALTPHAPFAESQSGPARTFTPEIRVNSIVAGAKSLTH